MIEQETQIFLHLLAKTTFLGTDLHPYLGEKFQVVENSHMFFERFAFKINFVLNIWIWFVLSLVIKKMDHPSSKNI